MIATQCLIAFATKKERHEAFEVAGCGFGRNYEWNTFFSQKAPKTKKKIETETFVKLILF
jgi:hypothetical protein